MEVDRPNRQARRQSGKSDPADAVEAARAALSGRAAGTPKTRDGRVEAIRALVVAKRSARRARIAALCQMRQLSFTAPDPIRERLKGLSSTALWETCASLRPRPSTDVVDHATKVALRSLGRRIEELEEEVAGIDALLSELVAQTAPGLLALYGVGIDTAASLLVTAGDNPERLRSEAAFAHLCGVAPIEAFSGKVIRHRAQPRRGPLCQPGAVAHRHGAPRLGPEDPGLHGTSHQGRPLEARGDPHPEALRGPGGLLPTPSPLRSPRTELGPGDTWQLTCLWSDLPARARNTFT